VLGLEYLGRTDLTQVPPDLDEAGPDELSAGPIEAAPAAPPAAPTASATAAATVAGPVQSTRKKNGNHTSAPPTAVLEVTAGMDVMTAHLSEMMGDAPFCDVCGHITVRNGACYKCLNCGNSLGCS
jgi:ribonucleoside-diphosphate reductase alpha chain